MKLCFVSVESGEREFFAERFREWRPVFLPGLEDVPADAEVLSIFMDHVVDAAFLRGHPRLRLIATRSLATDHVDLSACEIAGVEVASVGRYDGNSVAEHTFALLLAVARRLRAATTLRASGGFSAEQLRGFELRGKTLGLIGVGRVGARVAELARAFGMNVVACDPRPDAPQSERVGFRYLPFEEVLASAQVLSLHAALTPATRHLLNAETLAKCQEGVVIINTARGGLIDTAALAAAVESGQVGGAGLDVLEDERVLRQDAKAVLASEIAARVHRTGGRANEEFVAERQRQISRVFFSNALLARPDVIFTPHIAFNTNETVEFLNERSAEILEDFLSRHAVADSAE